MFTALALQAAATNGNAISEKEKADSLYIKGEYRDAAGIYAALAEKTASADIYYNLGNSYYRLNEYPEARLAFERALLLAPSDKDARRNLKLTVAKIKANDAKPQSFIAVFAMDVCHLLDMDEWAVLAFVSFLIALGLFLLYYFGWTTYVRKLAFFGFLACFGLTALALLCASVQNSSMKNPSAAIVLQTADVHQSPTRNSKIIRQLSPGTKVELTEGNAGDDWRQLSLGSGGKGWVEASGIGIVEVRE